MHTYTHKFGFSMPSDAERRLLWENPPRRPRKLPTDPEESEGPTEGDGPKRSEAADAADEFVRSLEDEVGKSRATRSQIDRIKNEKTAASGDSAPPPPEGEGDDTPPPKKKMPTAPLPKDKTESADEMPEAEKKAIQSVYEMIHQTVDYLDTKSPTEDAWGSDYCYALRGRIDILRTEFKRSDFSDIIAYANQHGLGIGMKDGKVVSIERIKDETAAPSATEDSADSNNKDEREGADKVEKFEIEVAEGFVDDFVEAMKKNDEPRMDGAQKAFEKYASMHSFTQEEAGAIVAMISRKGLMPVIGSGPPGDLRDISSIRKPTETISRPNQITGIKARLTLIKGVLDRGIDSTDASVTKEMDSIKKTIDTLKPTPEELAVLIEHAKTAGLTLSIEDGKFVSLAPLNTPEEKPADPPEQTDDTGDDKADKPADDQTEQPANPRPAPPPKPTTKNPLVDFLNTLFTRPIESGKEKVSSGMNAFKLFFAKLLLAMQRNQKKKTEDPRLTRKSVDPSTLDLDNISTQNIPSPQPRRRTPLEPIRTDVDPPKRQPTEPLDTPPPALDRKSSRPSTEPTSTTPDIVRPDFGTIKRGPAPMPDGGLERKGPSSQDVANLQDDPEIEKAPRAKETIADELADIVSEKYYHNHDMAKFRKRYGRGYQECPEYKAMVKRRIELHECYRELRFEFEDNYENYSTYLRRNGLYAVRTPTFAQNDPRIKPRHAIGNGPYRRFGDPAVTAQIAHMRTPEFHRQQIEKARRPQTKRAPKYSDKPLRDRIRFVHSNNGVLSRTDRLRTPTGERHPSAQPAARVDTPQVQRAREELKRLQALNARLRAETERRESLPPPRTTTGSVIEVRPSGGQFLAEVQFDGNATAQSQGLREGHKIYLHRIESGRGINVGEATVQLVRGNRAAVFMRRQPTIGDRFSTDRLLLEKQQTVVYEPVQILPLSEFNDGGTGTRQIQVIPREGSLERTIQILQTLGFTNVAGNGNAILASYSGPMKQATLDAFARLPDAIKMVEPVKNRI